MRVTSLGHASLVIEAAHSTVFSDPVFFDPFEVESVSCPRREVELDALPRPDAIVLSHAHLDHFDAPSLARLPRSTPVYIPPDARLHQALQGLEFWKVKVLEPWEPVRVGALTLMATPSKSSYETGLVVRDGDGTVWNQVDTVVTQATTRRVLEVLEANLIDHHVTELVGRQLPRAMEALKHHQLVGPLRRLWDRRARLEVAVVTPTTTLVWHLARWMPEIEWVAGASPEPDYTFTYVGSELVRAFTRQLPLEDVQFRAARHRRSDTSGSPYRLQAIDPARLHGVDVYETVDEVYGWSPLVALVDAAQR